MRIGFCLVSYGNNQPAGMERSVAALLSGLEGLGHQCHVIAAGPPQTNDPPNVFRMSSLTLPLPATDSQLASALGDGSIERELRQFIATAELDVVCWVDALWGLGCLPVRSPQFRSVVMVHVLGGDLATLRAAIGTGDNVVICPSNSIRAMAGARGIDSSRWKVVPNALLTRGVPPSIEKRARLFEFGPIRAICRLGREKGVPDIIQHIPPDLGRKFEIVLAHAGFEATAGSQDEILRACNMAAEARGVVVLDAIPWDAVQPFLAGACLTIVPSLAESFGLVALESMSVGTPVVAFDADNLSELVPSVAGGHTKVGDFARLWESAKEMINNESKYYELSDHAITLSASYSSARIAAEFVHATMVE